MKIYIKRFPLFMRVGHFTKERDHERIVTVCLELTVAKMTSATFEDLGSTIDYGEVIALLNKEFAGQTIKLLESLTFEIGQILFNKFSALQKVLVTVEKSLMSAKLIKGASISVESEFTREDFS